MKWPAEAGRPAKSRGHLRTAEQSRGLPKHGLTLVIPDRWTGQRPLIDSPTSALLTVLDTNDAVDRSPDHLYEQVLHCRVRIGATTGVHRRRLDARAALRDEPVEPLSW